MRIPLAEQPSTVPCNRLLIEKIIMLKKLIPKISAWIDSALKGTRNHYFCFLPQGAGVVSYHLRKLFYCGIHITKEQLSVFKKIDEKAIVVYATKYKSHFEYLFYHTRYRQLKLPVPEIGLGYRIFGWQPLSRIFKVFLAHIDFFCRHFSFQDPYKTDYIAQKLIEGHSALFAMVEEKGFYRRFVKKETDPIEYLIKVQKQTDRPIVVIPHLMFFTRKPQRSVPPLVDILFGSEGNPGKIRRLIMLFKNPGNVFAEISEPVNLKEFIDRTENQNRSIEYQALVLRRNLLVQINRHRQSITGPVLRTREELKENILTSDPLREFMLHYSEKRDIPLSKVYKKAESHLEEIAANYNPGMVKIYSAIIKWITDLMFEGVTVSRDEINMIKKEYQKGPLIFIPCHKSHIDYIILNYILYHNNLPIPHIAAGQNLSFWPMGPLARGGGAFFIRRTFRGAVLYSRIFSEYIKNLLEEGFNIEFFIVGGRSRTGKLILPKLGLLSILLSAFKNGSCRDMVFVPTYIGYDRILEESAYINEIEGGQKKPESLLQVIKARKLLKKRYGRIYIKFHKPVSLNEILAQSGTTIDRMNPKQVNELCRNLGFRIINAINNVTVVTPHAIVAGAILNASEKKFTREQLTGHITTCMTHLNFQNPLMADSLLVDPVGAFEQVFETYVQRKFIEPLSKEKPGPTSDDFYTVNASKRPLLEYYKNNCISFFIPAAFTALAIIDKDAFQFSAVDLHEGYRFLQKLFKNEFAYDIDRPSEYFVRKTIKSFIDDAILMPHPTLPDTYNITSAGFRKLKFFAHFLKSYLESYMIVLNYFTQTPSHNNDKDRLKTIQALGSRMFKQQEIELTEALSKVNYMNAVSYFNTHNVKGSQDSETIDFYIRKLQRYIDHLSF